VLQVYKENPENIQALSALVRLSTDMGLKESEGYREELGRLERMQESRLNSSRSAPTRFGPPSRMGSSRMGQRTQQQPSSASFDDNRSDLSEYGYPMEGNNNRESSSAYMDNSLDRGDGLLDYDIEDDRMDDLGIKKNNRFTRNRN
jgi:hypothetical protein